MQLRKKEPQGINPAILILERPVVPPKGIEPQHVVTQPVTFEERTTSRYEEVQILPDGVTLHVKHVREMEHSSSGA